MGKGRSSALATLVCDEVAAGGEPVTVGVAMPPGALPADASAALRGPDGVPRPVQSTRLMRWPDGSAKWLLLDFIADDEGEWRVTREAPAAPRYPLEISPDRFAWLGRERRLSAHGLPFEGRLTFVDAVGLPIEVEIDRDSAVVEAAGPIRGTVRFDGTIGDLRVRVRVTGWTRRPETCVEITLHNPNPAVHAGGRWDLGDRGSQCFVDFGVRFEVPIDGPRTWRAHADAPFEPLDAGLVKVFQASSGGERWQSINHVNRHGEVPLAFRGWRGTADGADYEGRRATPEVCAEGIDGTTVRVTVSEFWQNFPKVLQLDAGSIRVGLWPAEHGDLHELQGGERKRHVVWLSESPRPLDSAHASCGPVQPPSEIAASGAVGPLSLSEADDARVRAHLAVIVEPERGLAARRELIDEYGWRHYGDLYGDHEAVRHPGAEPMVSHYNNQYDCIDALLLQYLRTGDRQWFALACPLARHVMDVDLYHTDGDRAAFNRGMFWHTDHYLPAHTATHRSYSVGNADENGGKSYGGGPSNEHNYPSGILLYYGLTGDPEAAAVVRQLGDWVVAMEDGSTTIFSLLDGHPTGFASQTAFPDFHGPGRGAGNTINAACEAFRLDGCRANLAFAERIIRRCVHPSQDLAELDLLDAENRWSYTVFLKFLSRYLDLKREFGERDRMYYYARDTFVHFGRWMVEHEQPSTTHVERLEHHTETWAAQDLRKASVVEQAAVYVGPDERVRMLEWAGDAFDAALAELSGWATATKCRPLILAIHPAISRAYASRHGRDAPRFDEPHDHDFGAPKSFVRQRTRAIRGLRTYRGAMRAAMAALSPRAWRRVREPW